MIFTNALLLASTLAVPADTEQHQLEYMKRNRRLVPFFYPATTYTIRTVVESFELSPVDDLAAFKVAKKALLEELKLKPEELLITRKARGRAGTFFVFCQHVVDGIPVDNHLCSATVRNGQVTSISSSFKGEEAPKRTEKKFTLALAIEIAEKEYPGLKRDDFKEKEVMIQLPSGELVLAYQFQVRGTDEEGNPDWMQISVSTHTGQVIQVVDYSSKATYDVIPLPRMSPEDGFAVIKNPENTNASPRGWSTNGETNGNNVHSLINGRPVRASPDGSYETSFDPKASPSTPNNMRAAVVNTFYLANYLHDVFYGFGFDEASGNFQDDNFGKGGRGNDAVRINNHAAGNNNANFLTPPDGQPGVMNMFTWTSTNPNRDGSLDNTIPVHEYGHGVSNRLTGDPRQANCLQAAESRGLGEGWADAFAIFLSRKASDTRDTNIAVGAYAARRTSGIRQYPYSTNMRTSPLTYNSLNGMTRPHRMGEVWAAMLNELYWNILDRFPFNGNWYNAKQKAGNIIAMHLVVSGLKLQPCNPTFIDSRNAILQADKNVYGGEFQCEIWKAFAKRGMGTKAKKQGRYVADSSIPEECNGKTPTQNSPIVVPSPSAEAPTTESEPAPEPEPEPKDEYEPKTDTKPDAPKVPKPDNKPKPTGTVPDGVPTSEIPAPTELPTKSATKLIFGPTRAYATGPTVRGKQAVISYDLKRMGRVCSRFAICVSSFSSKETCLVQKVGPRGKVKDVAVTFARSGTAYLRFVTYGAGCFKQDTSGFFGYQVPIRAK